jgi:hypothetical protein
VAEYYWQTLVSLIRGNRNILPIDTQPGITEYGIDENGPPRLVAELREYLLSPVEPNLRLNPNWLTSANMSCSMLSLLPSVYCNRLEKDQI